VVGAVPALWRDRTQPGTIVVVLGIHRFKPTSVVGAVVIVVNLAPSAPCRFALGLRRGFPGRLNPMEPATALVPGALIFTALDLSFLLSCLALAAALLDLRLEVGAVGSHGPLPLAELCIRPAREIRESTSAGVGRSGRRGCSPPTTTMGVSGAAGPPVIAAVAVIAPMTTAVIAFVLALPVVRRTRSRPRPPPRGRCRLCCRHCHGRNSNSPSNHGGALSAKRR